MLGFGKKSNKEKANKIFTKSTGYHTYDIAKCSLIHDGFTNISYRYKLENGNEYQIRIGNDQEFINRKNEKLFLDSIGNKDYISLDTKNGNAVKKWIIGKNPDEKTSGKISFLNKLNKAIEKLHTNKLNKQILYQDFGEFFEKSSLEPEIKNKYLSLLETFRKDKLVMSHNDINPANTLIIGNNEIYFIDYEWARINYYWWDITNYIREVNLPLWKTYIFCLLNNISFKQMKQRLFVCTCFAYQWTFYMQQTDKIVNYQKKVKKLMEYYFKKVK